MPNFVVTTVGAAAASAASPSGPRIRLTEFRLGSNSTTPASAGDTGMAGTVVYSGTPSHFSLYDANTVQVILEIPASAGPFSYGEIGIFLSTGVLFARFSYGELKTKTSTAVTGYAQIRRIHALLRIEQDPAVFNFYTGAPPLITEYPNLGFVVAPSVIATTPVVLVHEPTPYNDSILLHSHTDNLWTIDDYVFAGNATLTASTENSLTATLFGTLGDTAVSGKYLMQTPTGQIRSVTSITGNVATIAMDMAPIPATSSIVHVYEAVESVAGRVNTLDSNLKTLAIRDIGLIRMRPYLALEATELECNGAAIDRTYFSGLFAKIGTLYGAGNGTTTFNIPDYRGTSLRALDNGRGFDPARVIGSYQPDSVKTHTHSTAFGGSGVVADGNFANPAGGISDRTAGTTGGFGSSDETVGKNYAALFTMVARTGFEIGAAPPPEAILTLAPNPASSSMVVGDSIVNVVVSSYAPTGNATLSLISGSMPPGVTINDDGASLIRINGSPTTPGSFSASYTVTQGIYASSFTYNATVTATPPPPPAPAAPVVSITNQTVDSPRATYGATYVTYNVQNNGVISLYRPNQSAVPVYEYPSGEWYVSGTAANVEVRADITSGPSLYSGSSPTGVWLSTTSPNNWTQSDSSGGSGTKTTVVTVQMRNSVTLAVLDTAVITLTITP